MKPEQVKLPLLHDTPKPRAKRQLTSPVAQAIDDYRDLWGGIPPRDRIASAITALVKECGDWARVRLTWRWYLEGAKLDGRTAFSNPQDFAQRFGELERMRLNGHASEKGAASSGRSVDYHRREHERVKEAVAELKARSGEAAPKELRSAMVEEV